MSPSSAGAAAPGPQQASPVARTSAAQAPRSDPAPATSSSPARTATRVTGSTYSGLKRLAAAGSAVCALNGAAAYGYAVNDAGHVATVVAEQQAGLEEVSRIVTAMPTSAKSASPGTSSETAHLKDIGTGSQRLAEAAARAAAGPTAMRSDAARFEALSASYARYVSTVERARASRGSSASGLYQEAETLRQNEIAPALGDLTAGNTTRREGAERSRWLWSGLLGLSSLAALGTLLGGSWWLARATKRILNPGLVAATLVAAGTSYYAFTTAAAAGVGPFVGPLVIVGGLVSAGLAWAGVQQRLEEYR